MQRENIIKKRHTDDSEEEAEKLFNSNEISRETLVKMLIEKGGCTSDEMSKLEDVARAEKAQHKNISIVNINNPYDRGKFPGLKKVLSKHRWSRRLGTRLFGWKWKKVKRHSSFS